MNEESIKYLDKKFNRINGKFNKIEEILEGVKKDVAVSKTNILVGFDGAKEEHSKIKARIDETYNAVDGFIKIVAKLEDEFTALKEDPRRVKIVIKEKLGVDLT